MNPRNPLRTLGLAAALALALALTLTSLSARAETTDDTAALQTAAVTGQVADVGTTAVGLALGAAEANPLGLVALGVKALMYDQIQRAPASEQPALWSIYGAFGWGATANNLCVIAAITTGGIAGALCPLIGLATGLSVYSADEDARTRATNAAQQEAAQ
jgi:hypothetical protein